MFKGGGQSIPLNIQEGIRSYLHENSSPASNRMVRLKPKRKLLNEKRFIPARYLSDLKIELYKNSPYKNIVSKSTFFKYSNIDGEFKNPFRYEQILKIINS